MEQNRTKLTIVNMLALLAAGVVALVVARNAQSLAAYAALPFLLLGVLASGVSFFQMRLAERERLEKLEYDELTRSPSASGLFAKSETETLPAQRARRQFERFFVPGFTIALLLGEGTGVFFLGRWLMKAQVIPLQQPMMAIVLFGLAALVLFMLGRYAVTLARIESNRLLQPVGSLVLGNAYVAVIVAAGIIAVYAGAAAADLSVARALVILLGFVAAETFLTLLLEVYRPRVRGKQLRLLYDSRVMGLLAQPESLFTTAAHALDYQFGFAVSQTRFFRFLQQWLAWIIAGQALLLVASTMFVVIETGEEALLERFGRPVQSRPTIGPGFHVKWPWPVDKVHRYRTERIQTFEVGLRGEEEKEQTLLWTVSHSKEEEFNLLVASRESEITTNSDAGRKSPPVNLLSVGIPVQFQITNLSAWAYNHSDPDQLMERIATREVVRYLISADLNEVMSSRRAAAAEELRKRIQQAADERSLGARIIFVGLQDIHPPVSVAEAYEKVVGALQSREAMILAARAQAVQATNIAAATAYRTRREAESDRDRTKAFALARAASFTNQIPAYRAAPRVYAERGYLQTLARNASNTRKYVLISTNTQDVILFNLEEKLRADLLDVPLPVPKVK